MNAEEKSSRRITGVETEYGCLIQQPGENSRAVYRVRDWLFAQQLYGLLDQHHRDWEEPPGNGGFLFNGGRLYVDMGHMEYCTPECASVSDVLRYTWAGDRLLLDAIKGLGLSGSVHFIRNNIDHHSGATFGCHENYSLLREAPVSERCIFSLLTFLTLRQLFGGAGRVGGAPAHPALGRPQRGKSPDFQISQRADYIQNDVYEWVQHNRAIINTRDEPLADPEKYRRLHLLHGDTNVLPAAQFLTIGSTRLMLDLLETSQLPNIVLADSVGTLRNLSHQPTGPWLVSLQDGRKADAVNILRQFRECAQLHLGGRDEETDAVLALWGRVEEGLSSDLDQLVGLVDWVTKRHLLNAFRDRENLTWSDPWLQAQDLEYHNIDPERSLGWAMANLDGPWADCLQDEASLTTPPTDTRASARSRWMHSVANTGKSYEIDWHVCRSDETDEHWLLDPFAPAP